MANYRIIETVTRHEEQPPCRTAEEMTQICCETTATLQCCETVEPWGGYNAQEAIAGLGLILDAQGRDSEGRHVEIRFAPRKGPCGEKVIRYDLSQNNCCDQIPAIEFDENVTADVLPHDSSIGIGWNNTTGGEITITTSSNGTWFAGGRKKTVVYGTGVTLFSGPTFCGNTAVTISDGCSLATKMIRSDLGSWHNLGQTCVIPGAAAVVTTPGVSDWFVTAYQGKYKTIENQRFGGFGFGSSTYRAHVCRNCSAGACTDNLFCRTCPSSFADMVTAAYRECDSGKMPSGGIRPCLDAQPPQLYVGTIGVVSDDGTTKEWAIANGYNTGGTCCGVTSSILNYQNMVVLVRGPSGLTSWVWEC